MPEHRAFLGDSEREFRLTAPMIAELERKTGVGIGALINRVLARAFFHADLIETIRLALIGAGTTPQEAQALVAAYVVDRPLSESYPLALAILEALFAGNTDADEKKGDDDAAE